MAGILVEYSNRDPAQDLSAALESKRLLTDLGENRGFLLLSSLVQEQVDQTQQEILFTPCTSVDSALGQEYKKGGLEGRLAWEAVRKGYIASLEISIQHLRSKIDDDAEREPDITSAP